MDANGITYLNTFFVREELTADERLHFHELVHIVQWSLLGPERFLAVYADGLERFGYPHSPLEAMAYRLDSLFQQGGAPFGVEQTISREMIEIAGETRVITCAHGSTPIGFRHANAHTQGHPDHRSRA